jgi:phage terminase small subunit
MAKLTVKQLVFADAVAKGSHQTAAFREAYDADGMKPSTIWSEASRLRRHPKVAARIDQLKAEAELSAAEKREGVREFVLHELTEMACEASTPSARLKALELLGKSVGLFSDRVEVSAPERSIEELEAAIKQRIGM